MKTVEVAGYMIGSDYPCFIIAEAGVNHNGEVEMAKRLVDVAVDAGVNAVKFQTFKAERVVNANAPKAEYQLQTTDIQESQLEMLRGLELSFEAHRELQRYCEDLGVMFISTPFDKQSVDFLQELGVSVFKVGSGEITNHLLLEYIASKGMPIILSTGMSYLSEVDDAVRVIEYAGNEQLILLHCVSNYPADPSSVNLRAMETMAKAFQVPVGYSDHTLSIEVPLTAVALGACIVEKHFTLDRDLPGPDHRASLEPLELCAMVKGIRVVERALGNGIKRPTLSEMDNRLPVRRSLAVIKDVRAGTALEAYMLQAVRPATGIPPSLLECVIGRELRRSLSAGELIGWEDLT